MEKTLRQIAAVARTEPDRIFQVTGGHSSSYGELAARSDAVAAFVRQHGGPRQQPVIVSGHKEPEMIQAFIGCLKAGHPYVPVEFSLPPERLAVISERLNSPLLLTPETVRALPAAEPSSGAVTADEVAYVIYTSGSTGEPKGVPIRARSLEFFVDWMMTEQRFGENEVFLNQAPFCFDLSVMDFHCCLRAGGRLVSVTREVLADSNALAEFLQTSGVTTWVSTPSFARLCVSGLGFGAEHMPHLRRFLFCGETLPPAVAATLLERFPAARVWNTYGPTEATVATSSVQITTAWIGKGGPLPVGGPTPGSTIRILDSELKDQPAGERGEIVIAGPNVSPGYLPPHHDTGAFLELEGAWSYRTGDWGRIEDGQLYFEGRMDSQIKFNGYRMELGDIESHLRSLEMVRDAAVLTVIEDGEITALTACIIPETSGDAAGGARVLALRAALRKKLPSYMIPRNYRFLAEFPMTVNGKVDRKKLAELI